MTGSIVGGVGPGQGAPPLPGDPFKNFPNAGIHLSIDTSGNTGDGGFVVQVVPDIEHPDNVQSFSSGAVGNPSAEQIWAFKMRQLSDEIDRISALASNMEATVPPGREKVWGAGIQAVAGVVHTLQAAAKTVCDATGDPKP